jgi:hypothetical protein
MRPLLPLLLLFLGLGCGADAPPPAPTPERVVETVTPPPGAYDDDPLASHPPQEPLPPGVQPRPSPSPAPSEAAPAPPPPVATPAPAAPTEAPPPAPRGALSVAELILSTGVVDRAPTGVGDRFPDGTEVHCWTRIENPEGGTRTVRHRYLQGEELERSIELSIRGASWRTWSSKRVYGPGAWRVEVVDEAGEVLASKPFVVE